MADPVNDRTNPDDVEECDACNDACELDPPRPGCDWHVAGSLGYEAACQHMAALVLDSEALEGYGGTLLSKRADLRARISPARVSSSEGEQTHA